jgi:peptidylprolyl isomerase
MRIKDVIQAKASHEVVTIGPDATVRELVALLAEHNVGALVVSEDGERVDGIVSERDVVRRLHQDATVLDHAVASIMTAEVRTCAGDDGLTELMQTMTEHRIRHVPVVADGRLTGIISIGDVVKNRIGELESERDQLDHYVHQTSHIQRLETLVSEKPDVDPHMGDVPADLEVTDLVEGDGVEATSGSTVSVHYVGVAHSSGEEFDASYNRGTPLQFRLGIGQVISGWDTGVQGMKVGGRRRLVIPPHLGYGDRGAGGVIKPGETLIFVVDLLEVR